MKFGPQHGGDAGDDLTDRKGPVHRRARCLRFGAMATRSPTNPALVNEEDLLCRMSAKLRKSRGLHTPEVQSMLVAVRSHELAP